MNLKYTIKTKIFVTLLAVFFCLTSLIIAGGCGNSPDSRDKAHNKKEKTTKNRSIIKPIIKPSDITANYRGNTNPYNKFGKIKTNSRYSRDAKSNTKRSDNIVPVDPLRPPVMPYGVVLERWNIGAGTAEEYDPENAGGSVIATMYSGGFLIISGTGDCMYGAYGQQMPWLEEYSDSITNILFQGASPTNMQRWFAGCTALTGQLAVDIPGSVTSLNSTFESCTGITDLGGLSIPASVTDMGNTFHECTGLTSLDGLTIPGSVTNMANTFALCTGITDLSGLNIPASVTNVTFTFFGCRGLTSLDGFTITGSITYMNGTFFYCSGLTSLDGFDIPSSVTSMSSTFAYCSGLTSLDGFTIPDSVTSMNRTFQDCTNLGGTMTIMGNPSSYISCFENAATHATSAGVIIDYTAECTNIDSIIATKSAGSRIRKGISHGDVLERWNIGAGTAAQYDPENAGGSVIATMYSGGLLYISGMGDCMYGAYGQEMPWLEEYSDSITNILVQGASPTNMQRWFAGCTALTGPLAVDIPDSVTILNSTFEACTGITDLSGFDLPIEATSIGSLFRLHGNNRYQWFKHT